MYAALNRNEPVVTVLLETNEVNLYKTDTSGRTALSLAASKGYDVIAELLNKRGTH
jgi:ankyrin repeat protein